MIEQIMFAFALIGILEVLGNHLQHDRTNNVCICFDWDT